MLGKVWAWRDRPVLGAKCSKRGSPAAAGERHFLLLRALVFARNDVKSLRKRLDALGSASLAVARFGSCLTNQPRLRHPASGLGLMREVTLSRFASAHALASPRWPLLSS